MNWIRQNKFWAGFIAVMVIGVGVLGGLLFMAMSHFSQVSDQYSAQATDLKQLQSSPIYPDEGNVKKLQDQKQEVLNSIAELQKTLATFQMPIEQITPAQFQDQLRTSVLATLEKAKNARVQITDPKFYLGFETYQSSPPRAEAAPLLSHELKAIEMVIGLLIDSKIDTITTLARPLLPQEQEPGGPAGQHGNQGRGGGGGAGGGQSGLVKKTPFQIEIHGEQSSIRNALNAIASAKKQICIVRTVVLRNDNLKGPSRAEQQQDLSQPPPAAAAPGAPGAPAAPAQPPPAAGASTLKYVVGGEKLAAAMTIDIVDFATPASPPAAGGPRPQPRR